MSLFLGIAYTIRGLGEHRRALCIGKSGWHSVPGEWGDCNLHGGLFLSAGEVEDFGLSCMKKSCKTQRLQRQPGHSLSAFILLTLGSGICLSLLWPDSVISSGCYGQ